MYCQAFCKGSGQLKAVDRGPKLNVHEIFRRGPGHTGKEIFEKLYLR